MNRLATLAKVLRNNSIKIGLCGLVVVILASGGQAMRHKDLVTNAAGSTPSICGGDWYAPDNPYQLVAGAKETWYQNSYSGGLQFSDHKYGRYVSTFHGDVSVSDAIGMNPVLWDILTFPSLKVGSGISNPNKYFIPNSIPGYVSYLTVDTCSGLTPQRSYNWSFQGDREYYLFSDSTLVRSNSYGWHEIRGLINAKYVQQKGWQAWLGIPTSDELAVTGGKVSHFTGGDIYWAPSTGAFAMRADQFNKWQSLGGSAGPLGNPVSDNASSAINTTTGTTSPNPPQQTHTILFQNNCRIVVTSTYNRAYCNGKEVTGWSPTTPPPASTPNKAPVASFSFTRKPGAGNIVLLDGGASIDPDGSIVRWKWTKNGTPIGSGTPVTVSMGNVTSATVVLTVTDNRGATASVTRTLSLPNRTPTVTSVSPPDGSTAGSNTPRLSVTANDDDADAMQYNFHLTGPAADVGSGWTTNPNWTVPPYRLDPGVAYNWTVAVKDSRGATSSRASVIRIAMLPTAKGLVSTPSGNGYWQVATDGGVFAFGDAGFYGSLPGVNVKVTNILGMARTPTGKGYWLVGSDGGVFAFGDAPFHGSLPGLNIRVNNIVGMSPTKDGKGYWLVGSDGGVFAFGNAGFYGSMGGKPLNKPVVAIAPTPNSDGYWLAAGDGGVFAFGSAPFYGSMGGKQLNAPVTDITPAPDGKGYWMVAEDGGVFAFGNARFYGSMAGKPLNGHITGMSPLPNGSGYWLNGCDGGIFAFGNAQFYGSLPRYGCRGVIR